jgi:hypothetical protein
MVGAVLFQPWHGVANDIDKLLDLLDGLRLLRSLSDAQDYCSGRLQGLGGFSQRPRDLLAMGSQDEPAVIGSHRAVDERDQHALFKPAQRA